MPALTHAVILASVLHLKEAHAVNKRFNKFTYISDYEHMGKADYWQSPEEFIANGKGDCEDYAIAKYSALLRMGVNPDSLRMAYVVVTNRGSEEAHMVLLLEHEDDFWVLDNMVDSIDLLSQRKDIFTVYSFNTHQLWTHHRKTGEIEERPYSENLGPVQRLRGLIARS